MFQFHVGGPGEPEGRRTPGAGGRDGVPRSHLPSLLRQPQTCTQTHPCVSRSYFFGMYCRLGANYFNYLFYITNLQVTIVLRQAFNMFYNLMLSMF